MQSNEEKFLQQKAFLEKAQKQLQLLWSESMILDLDNADKLLDKCHTEITSMKVIHETLG
ncbi:hypothetical protein F0919_18110 [Taibaiella lutea]|uniref:Uncharacterized protein n=1 Tax=Taibaiella lutea TaxID=2608001 RepID=A0A5M6CH06_9BACT|nr:hypothetical protein [Taibaiella lutea]KAA5532695.1 hypothetical protein F0919_18110 [Taibaiella lutea]